MESSANTKSMLISLLVISSSLSGCGGIGPGSPNANLTSDQTTVNAGDSINFDSFDLEDIINEAEKAIHKVKSLVE